MTNFFLKKYGAVTLIISTILLVTTTLIIIFAANFNMTQEKITANIYRHNQAFTAAQAGLEFGINYLQQQSSTILSGRASGYLLPYTDTNITNVLLSNGSKFSILYSNPLANNFNLIQIVATGTSDDGVASRSVSQLLQFGSLFLNGTQVPLSSKGAVNLGGSSLVYNNLSANSIQSGSTISISGAASTLGLLGTSIAGLLGSDVQQNLSSISSLSQNDYFASFFGVQPSTVKNSVNTYYNNSASTNYSSALNGVTGSSIWIDQTGGTATINGSTTIGSTINPVLLIVNGPLNISGNVTIYGYVFVLGATGVGSVIGNVQIIGGMGVAGSTNISGNVQLIYSTTVLSNLKNQASMQYFAKVPGSWKDF